MVKLFLPNSASPGQESQKCLENKCTALVTSRKTRSFVTSRSDFITSRSEKNFDFGHLAQREKNFDFGHLAHHTAMREVTKVKVFFSLREVTKDKVFL